jgi:hypothetical protein
VSICQNPDFLRSSWLEGTNGNTAFQGIYRCGEAFPFQPYGFFVFLEVTVYGRRAYLFEFFRDFPCDTEGGPLGDVDHLLPHKGARIFPHLNQKKV